MIKKSSFKNTPNHFLSVLALIALTLVGIVNIYGRHVFLSANLFFEDYFESFFEDQHELFVDHHESFLAAPELVPIVDENLHGNSDDTVLSSDDAVLPPLPESIGDPVSILIPSIAVHAPIEKVALTKDGAMDVPSHPFNTGWYDPGPRPGETGSAAIGGHLNWEDGSDAVFADLKKVKPGDEIAIQDDKGQLISFMVRETRIYDAYADASDVFTSDDGKAHLNLITCQGFWDKMTNQYSERLVVFADQTKNDAGL